MTNITSVLRKYIGSIIAGIGFLLLCIMTFGDLGEITTKEYWNNVRNNLTSIGFMTVGLTLIQTVIKQGLAEQALQRGLNSTTTTEKYEAHRKLIKQCIDKLLYLPYFLQIYNKRHTELRKREFLINNGYRSEAQLRASGRKHLIKNYDKIKINITASSIKWSTLEVIYDKHGRIITLTEYRRKRLVSGVISSILCMIGVTFLTGGLFFSTTDTPLWQKFVKLLCYILCIAIGGIFTVIKEYEKGAFGVPNELDEINQIWHEFITWVIPQSVKDEVDAIEKEFLEVNNEQTKATNDRTAVQEKQEESEGICNTSSDSVLCLPCLDGTVCVVNDEK